MMWTIMSPRSTSTHSPVSSPSMPMTSPPASLTLSRTDAASALVWRLEVPETTAMRSNRLVRCVGVEHDDVLALDVFKGVDDEGLQFFDIH